MYIQIRPLFPDSACVVEILEQRSVSVLSFRQLVSQVSLGSPRLAAFFLFSLSPPSLLIAFGLSCLVSNSTNSSSVVVFLLHPRGDLTYLSLSHIEGSDTPSELCYRTVDLTSSRELSV